MDYKVCFIVMLCELEENGEVTYNEQIILIYIT